MRRILLTTSLAAACVLGTAGTAGADIGDITEFGIAGESADDLDGTAETAEVEGVIRCTTGIEYGLVLKVSQFTNHAASQPAPNPPQDTNDADVEGVGAFGPNAGNEANSPCSTSLQSWDLVVERNRDSGTFEDNDTIGVFALAGTSAENGDRGPGPFIGDSEYDIGLRVFNRTDP